MAHMAEIRLGVVGLGFGRQVHVPAFQRIPGCRVAALAGRDREAASAAAALIPGCQPFGSWREMLAAGGLDAISIAVPPAAQPTIVEQAARCGLAVFCEKPLAADQAAAERMLAAVRAHGVKHAVNFLFPEIPAWQATRQAVESLLAHRPLKAASLTWQVETYAHRHDLRNGWKRSPEQGGGALSTFVSHSAYYLEWLFGPIRRLIARLLPAAGDDARVHALIDFASGLPVALDVATDCPFGPGHRLEIQGVDGGIRLWNQGTDYVRGFTFDFQSRDCQAPPPPAPLPDDDDGRIWATNRIATRFIAAVRGTGRCTPDLDAGLRVQSILEAFRASARTNAWVEVPSTHG